MAAKPGVAVDVTKWIMQKLLIIFLLASCASAYAQDSTQVYKKRVLESTEVEFMASLYMQDGDHAAVSGGKGTEQLVDFAPAIVLSIPLSADEVLTIDAGVSAYTSASSSNVNPYDARETASPFQASSGASKSDVWWGVNSTYSHSSDDRNTIWTATLAVAAEYDYRSFGVGGSYARLFNEKNTELSIKGHAYFDSWSLIEPYELRGGDGGNSGLLSRYTVTGNPNYNPSYIPIENGNRNSYSVGLGFSQILTENMQASLALDVVEQQGWLSTPFQRVYFSDVPDSYIEDFQLADDVERLPDARLKIAAGGRLNYYINERVVLRTFYRYYFDDWGVRSNTANIELPIKLSDKYTLYPSYRFYNQSAADYFAPYEEHLSTEEFYTSDYDLSNFSANQYGLGIKYTDAFTERHIWRFGLKNVHVKYLFYHRNIAFQSHMLVVGCKFVLE